MLDATPPFIGSAADFVWRIVKFIVLEVSRVICSVV